MKFHFLTLALFLAGGLLLTQCKNTKADAASEETAQTPEPETELIEITETVVIVVQEREQLKNMHKVKAPVVEREPEKYAEVVHEDIVQAPTRESASQVVFIPHRTTYLPWNTLEKKELEAPEALEPVRRLTQFDVPPMYAYEECKDNKHPDHCSHMQLQAFFSKNIDMSVAPDDSEDHVEYVSFIVKKDGTVDPTLIEVIDQTPHCIPCAQEAKRLVEMLDGWKPGIWQGREVDARITLPVRFHYMEM